MPILYLQLSDVVFIMLISVNIYDRDNFMLI